MTSARSRLAISAPRRSVEEHACEYMAPGTETAAPSPTDVPTRRAFSAVVVHRHDSAAESCGLRAPKSTPAWPSRGGTGRSRSPVSHPHALPCPSTCRSSDRTRERPGGASALRQSGRRFGAPSDVRRYRMINGTFGTRSRLLVGEIGDDWDPDVRAQHSQPPRAARRVQVLVPRARP
jgi:hypothetical protein